jgi:hypothetical protein
MPVNIAPALAAVYETCPLLRLAPTQSSLEKPPFALSHTIAAAFAAVTFGRPFLGTVMSTPRRDFLQQLTISGLALGTFPAVAHAESASHAGAAPHADWLMEVLQPPAAAFDTSWTAKLTGKYKTVFDVPEINGGGGVWRAGLWTNHTRDVLKAEPGDVTSVVVIRHAAIPLAMNHAFWDAYDVAKENKVTHPMTGKKTRRNPVLMTVEEDALPPNLGGITLQKQIEKGTIVLACNTAFGGMVGMVARKDKLPFGEARTKALSMLVPGVILQPNGIFGVALAQHHGCGFVAAS